MTFCISILTWVISELFSCKHLKPMAFLAHHIKKHGFFHQYKHANLQQNPSYEESLGNSYLYFSHSTGTSFPMVYFITWEKHGFFYQLHIARRNATKLILWRESGKLCLITFPFAKQLYWNRTSAWMFSCKFAAYFQNNFS